MIYAYTSASKAYGSAAVAKINRTKVLLQGLLSREHCFETRKGKVIKNLLIVANWHLKDIIIVDNLVTSFALQLNNGIPILDFLGDPAD